jgi:hypothetical protein
MANNIGSMFLEAGKTIGTSIGQPVSSLGTSIGGMLTRSAEREREKNAEEQFQQIMAAHQNNPAELQRQGLRAKASGDKNLQRIGDMLLDEAQRVQTVFEKQASRTTALVDRGRSRYDALVAARPETDTAFEEAVTLRRTLQTAKERAESSEATDKDKRLYDALKTRSITPQQYTEEMIKDRKLSSKIVDVYNPNKGIEEKVQIIVDDVTKKEVDREVLGPVAPKQYKSPLDTAKGMEIIETTRASMNKAGEDASTLESAAAFAQNRDATQRGALGAVFSGMREFAGVGTEVEFHRAQIRQIRMQGVLGMLPPGVASDKDVKLAMDASVDFNSLDNETAASYLRGLAKIKRAQQTYESEKLRWIRETEDPNALGFDDYVAYKDARNRMVDFVTGDAAKEFLKELAAARQLPEPQQTEQMQQLREAGFGDELNELDQIEAAIANWENYDKKPEGFKDA